MPQHLLLCISGSDLIDPRGNAYIQVDGVHM
jgi:hypothetical protein